jgi:hypothetical protein
MTEVSTPLTLGVDAMPTASPSLCSLCSGMTLEGINHPGTMQEYYPGKWRSNEDSGYAHHVNLDALEKSGSDGCQLCKMFWHGVCKRIETWHGKASLTLLSISDSQLLVRSLYSAGAEQVPGLLLYAGSRLIGQFGVYVFKGMTNLETLRHGSILLITKRCSANFDGNTSWESCRKESFEQYQPGKGPYVDKYVSRNTFKMRQK